jgi:UDP-N-acetylglucosamine 2-epimerase
MYDVLKSLEPQLEENAQRLLPTLGVRPGEFALLTIHRASNTDDTDVLRQLAAAISDIPESVIFPVHPRTRNLIEKHQVAWGPRVRLIEPVGLRDMLTLQRSASHVITDSGGVQKEAFLLGVPCITLREETEWPETVEAGWNVLVGHNRDALIEAFRRPAAPPSTTHPYGVGDAAIRIARSLGA